MLDMLIQPCATTTCRNNNNTASCATTTTAGTTVQLMEPSSCVLLGLQRFTAWLVENLALGSVLFALLYATCTVCLVPTSALTLGGGAAFTQAIGLGPGLLLCSLTVFAGASTGAIVAFLLARYLLHDYVQSLVRRFRLTAAVDAAVREAGLKLMILFRLSPLIPFGVFNYAIAGTSVSFRDYALALPAMLPGTATYAYIGATVAEAAVASQAADASSARALQTTLLAIGAVATVGAVVLISWFARRELAKSVQGAQSQQQDRGGESGSDG